MLKKKKKLNNKGMAALEMIPIIVVVVLLLNFSLGFFGVVHTGILNSIASRNYAFETFRNRANLTYFNPLSNDFTLEFSKVNFRVHGVTTENTNQKSDVFVATTRMIDFFNYANGRAAGDEASGNSTYHSKKVQEVDENGRNEDIAVNPVWIKTLYGICLNPTCKPN